jgi:hypothetical protein
MPFLTPLSAAPTGAGSDPATYSAANPGKVFFAAPSADGITVTHQATAAAVTLRPYFWMTDDGTGKIANSGRWVGIGTDAVSGAAGSKADPALYNGCAHGRYQDEDSGGRSWILVVESGLVANVVWARLDANRRTTTTT